MGNHKGYRNRHLMLWVQEMEFPPLTEKELRESAKVMPMTSAWQALQDPDDNALNPEEGKFFWDGMLKPNPNLTGAWQTIGTINSLVDFDPAKPKEANRAPVQAITFQSNGTTDDPLWIWSGDTLMNLRKNEALTMSLQSVSGTDYLFIQAGGFQTKNGNQWKSPLFVLKRP